MTHAAVRRSRDRAGSTGADSRQTASRVQRKRQIRDDEQRKHIRPEKFKELEQTVTTEGPHCLQRRYHQQRGVVPARSRDEYTCAGGSNTEGWRRYGRPRSSDMGTVDCSLGWPAHTRLQLYILV